METVKPYTTRLNKGNAYWMARLAHLIYTKHSKKNPAPDEKKILAALQAEDDLFISVTGFSKDSEQAAIIEHQNYFTMVFRGTDEIADWADNLNFFSEKVLFGRFHRGFWNAVENVWDDLFDCYLKLKAINHKPLFITGHSLGGAMATIAAARMIHKDLPFTSVYTFGQPRAVERDAVVYFNVEAKERFFRFQNNNDIVTRIPSRLMGYSHVGTYLYISEKGTLYDDPGFWFRFLDGVGGAIEAIKECTIDAIDDHNMQHYVDAVRMWRCDFSGGK